MAIKKNPGRQTVITVIQPLNFDSTANKGEVDAIGTFNAIDLPSNAIVVGGYLNVKTGTTVGVTVALGDVGSAARYLAATSAVTVAKTALLTPGYQHTTPTTLFITVAGATPVIAAASEIVLQYVVSGRAEFSQG
jgi:hypothetical protein